MLLDSIYQVGGNYYIEDFMHPFVEKGMQRFKLAIIGHLKKNMKGEPPRAVVFRDWYMN